MFGLTTQQRKVVAVACLLLLVGGAVRAWRLGRGPESREPGEPSVSLARTARPSR